MQRPLLEVKSRKHSAWGQWRHLILLVVVVVALILSKQSQNPGIFLEKNVGEQGGRPRPNLSISVPGGNTAGSSSDMFVDSPVIGGGVPASSERKQFEGLSVDVPDGSGSDMVVDSPAMGGGVPANSGRKKVQGLSVDVPDTLPVLDITDRRSSPGGFGETSNTKGVRRIVIPDIKGSPTLVGGLDSPLSLEMTPRENVDSIPALPKLTAEDKARLGPSILEPVGIIPWNTLSRFVEPVPGEKNLFVYWGGTPPGPLIIAFFSAIFLNKGDFKMFLITDENKQIYMTQVVEGKQIAPDHNTKLPKDTHISWEVYDRVLTVGRLPFATQKDFIVNTMVAMYGGVYLDPGIIGPGKLDEWWKIMHSYGATYVNYAASRWREVKVIDQHSRSAAVDKEHVGKWNGDLWIDVFFTMAPVNSPMMKCFLHLTSSDPEFGPSSEQLNHSLYFIYGGDVFDACFSSLYEQYDSSAIEGFPYGVNLYPETEPVPIEGRPKTGGFGRKGKKEKSVFFTEQTVSGRKLLAENNQPAGPSGKKKASFFEDVDDLCEGGCGKLAEEVGAMLTRMDSGASSQSSETTAFKDPPNINGIHLPFPFSGKAIIIDQQNGDKTIKSNIIPQEMYQELAAPVWPDFATMLAMKHPIAILVNEAIKAVSNPDGTIYLKFYNTAGPLRTLSWEQLCGPPISFAMYLITETTGTNFCTGEGAREALTKTL